MNENGLSGRSMILQNVNFKSLIRAEAGRASMWESGNGENLFPLKKRSNHLLQNEVME